MAPKATSAAKCASKSSALSMRTSCKLEVFRSVYKTHATRTPIAGYARGLGWSTRAGETCSGRGEHMPPVRV